MANLLFIVGPTASGKTDFAIDIAKQSGAEIISADSVQFYRELVIGSARPSMQQLQEVRHHLVGHVSVAEDYTAGRFESEAMNLIASQPSKSFVICGGSGFYIQALQFGMYPISKADPMVQSQIEAEIDSRGLDAVYRDLERLDPETALKISIQDRYRIVRALEILRQLNGQKLSDVKRDFEAQRPNRFPGRKIHNFVIEATRDDLESRVELRAKKMLQEGLVTEVRELIDLGFATRPALQSVGYRETLDFLNNQAGPETELMNQIVKGTLRLAKKQRTWFSRLQENTTRIEIAKILNLQSRSRWVDEGVRRLD